MRDARIVDYAYYKDVYGGELNEQDFRKQEQKAEAYVNAITFGRIYAPLPDATVQQVKTAICALTDEYQTITKISETGAVSSESVATWKKTYRGPEKSSEQRLQATAQLYLATTGLLYCGGGGFCVPSCCDCL